MFVLLIALIGVVGLLVVPTIAARLYRVIENDGYGRPGSEAPRSHPRDTFDPRIA